MKRFYPGFALLLGLSLTAARTAGAVNPYVEFGPADVIAISQPLVEFEMIDPNDGLSDGPDLVAFPPNKIALADTAAQSVLLAAPAYLEPSGEFDLFGSPNPGKYLQERDDNGNVVQYTEQGVSGFATLDVLQPYQVQIPFSEGGGSFTSTPVRALGDPDLNLSFLGAVVGTSVFEGNALVLDHHQLVDPDEWIIFGVSAGQTAHVGVKLQSTLPVMASASSPGDPPATYRVDLRRIRIEPAGSDPLPDFGSLYGVEDFTLTHGTTSAKGTVIADTGAQLSLLFPWLADELGVDYNNDPNLETIEIGGLGGSTITAPVVKVDRIALPTAEGIDLVLTDAEFAIVDIPGLDTFGLPDAQRIGGILGYNVLASGYYDVVLAQILADFGVDIQDLIFTDEDGEIPNLDDAAVGYFTDVVFDFIDPDHAAMYLTANPALNVVVPEPASALWLGVGATVLCARRRQKTAA